MSKTAPTNITLPGNVLEDTDRKLIEPLSAPDKKFFGRPSRSMVIRALLEIALENSGKYNAQAAYDYESLKRELCRILKGDSTGG